MSGIKMAKVSIAKSIHWNLSGLLNIYVNIDKHIKVSWGHSQPLTNASNCVKLIKMHFIYEIEPDCCLKSKCDQLHTLKAKYLSKT